MFTLTDRCSYKTRHEFTTLGLYQKRHHCRILHPATNKQKNNNNNNNRLMLHSDVCSIWQTWHQIHLTWIHKSTAFIAQIPLSHSTHNNRQKGKRAWVVQCRIQVHAQFWWIFAVHGKLQDGRCMPISALTISMLFLLLIVCTGRQPMAAVK